MGTGEKEYLKMAMSINHAVISGNIVRDAELRRTASGMCIASFCVAVNDRQKNQNGEYVDRPSFVDCVWFGTGAEKCSGALVKGARVAVQGKLRQSTWERDGQKRSKIELIADVVMLPPRPSQETIQEPQAEYYSAEIPF